MAAPHKKGESSTRKARAFVVVEHAERGVLILERHKQSTDPYWQLPGGHAEDSDAVASAGSIDGSDSISSSVVTTARRRTAARELFEETGIDVRSTLHRLEHLPEISSEEKRSYFRLHISDADAASPRLSAGQQIEPVKLVCVEQHESGRGAPKNCFLVALTEHEKACFVPSVATAAEYCGRPAVASALRQLAAHEESNATRG